MRRMIAQLLIQSDWYLSSPSAHSTQQPRKNTHKTIETQLRSRIRKSHPALREEKTPPINAARSTNPTPHPHPPPATHPHPDPQPHNCPSPSQNSASSYISSRPRTSPSSLATHSPKAPASPPQQPRPPRPP